MDILTLKITNFLAVGDAPALRLSQQGLVLVQGANEDDSSATSNGVGKSSVVDALCWALYGETARGVTGDAVVNNVAKKDCSVAVELRDGDNLYRITRHRKHKAYKNATLVEVFDTSGGYKDISKATEADTQAFIVELIGSTAEVFMASVYAGQEAMPDLPRLTDKKLKMLIEEAAGIDRIERAYEIARERTREAERAFTTAQAAKAQAEDKVALASRNIEQLKLNSTAFHTNKAAEVSRLEAHLGKAIGARDVTTEIFAKLPAKEALQAQLAEVNGRIESVAGMQQRVRDLAVRLSTEKGELAAAENRLNATRLKAVEIGDSIKRAPELAAKPCRECGQQPTDSAARIEHFIAHQREKLNGEIDTFEGLKIAVEEAKSRAAAAQQALADTDAEVPDLTAENQRKDKLNEALRLIATKEREVADAHRAVTEVEVNLDKARAAADPYGAMLEKAEVDLVQASELVDKAVVLVGECEEALEIAQGAVEVFGPAGVRAHILDTVTPFLNDRTQEYLSVLSDGNISAVWSTLTKTAKGELREKFNIDVSNNKGADSFAGLSGGEKRKVRLATMLALQDMVAARATKPIQLYIGDEIDDALDVAGLERLMTVLDRKAKERGTVLVISHNDLNSWIDMSITVTKSGGLSTIEGCLCV